jgi:hypothetical protein
MAHESIHGDEMRAIMIILLNMAHESIHADEMRTIMIILPGKFIHISVHATVGRFLLGARSDGYNRAKE